LWTTENISKNGYFTKTDGDKSKNIHQTNPELLQFTTKGKIMSSFGDLALECFSQQGGYE